MKIELIDARVTLESRHCYLELEINNKNIEVSAWQSYDESLDCWSDRGWELLNKNIFLTNEEEKAIDDYISKLDFSKIK